MTCNMEKISKSYDGREIVAGVNTEWLKKRPCTPFCFALHAFYSKSFDNKNYCMGAFGMEAILLFLRKNEKPLSFLKDINNIIGDYSKKSTVFVGHQFASDLHFLCQASKSCELKHLETLKALWRHRNPTEMYPKAFDTRYDIDTKLKGKEKLLDVALRYNVYPVQEEYKARFSCSNEYLHYCKSAKTNVEEKIIVYNWRHALTSAMIYLVEKDCRICTYWNKCESKRFVTNNIMVNMRGELQYLKSKMFKQSLRMEELLRLECLKAH